MYTVTSVWSPDGLLAATSTTLGDIYVWDTTRGTNPIETVFLEHTHSVQHLVWNATTNLIASGDDSGRILVWNPATGEIIRELAGHNDAILDLDWRADGAQLVSTSLDHTVRVWDWPSGEGQVVRNGALVSALAYSPDGSELAYGGEITDQNDVRIEIIPVQSLLVPTPTRTFTPTPVPTLTPTPAATLIPAPFQKLRLTSMCSAQPGQYRLWRVRNSNPADVVFTWDIYHSSTGQNGFGVVPPAVNGVQGEVIFSSVTEAGANTLRLFVNGAQQDVKASSGATCPTPTPVP